MRANNGAPVAADSKTGSPTETLAGLLVASRNMVLCFELADQEGPETQVVLESYYSAQAAKPCPRPVPFRLEPLANGPKVALGFASSVAERVDLSESDWPTEQLKNKPAPWGIGSDRVFAVSPVQQRSVPKAMANDTKNRRIGRITEGFDKISAVPSVDIGWTSFYARGCTVDSCCTFGQRLPRRTHRAADPHQASPKRYRGHVALMRRRPDIQTIECFRSDGESGGDHIKGLRSNRYRLSHLVSWAREGRGTV